MTTEQTTNLHLARTEPIVIKGGEKLPAGVRHVGAPTDYKPEYCQQMVDFFESATIPGTPAPENSGKGSGKRNIEYLYSHMPTFQSFSRQIGVSFKSLQRWAQRHPAFSEAYERCKDIQAEHMSGGLCSGAYNPTGAIFVAKNLLGWEEKSHVVTENAEDSADTLALKAVLDNATQEQLSEFSRLIESMKASQPELAGQ